MLKGKILFTLEYKSIGVPFGKIRNVLMTGCFIFIGIFIPVLSTILLRINTCRK